VNVGIVGTGYVGLVTGACLAEVGNDVVCLDIDAAKIASLQAGKAPFYEPELDGLLAKNVSEERLSFTTDPARLAKQRAIFLCVGTPSGDDGNADLSALFAALDSILPHADGPKILVLKSTVPVGTAEKVRALIARAGSQAHSVVSNPEFLKQGAAIDDFMKPDRVVVGTSDEAAGDEISALYKPFVRTGRPILRMDHRSAEMMKYAANALLATRITFMNQLANLCDAVGADIEAVRLAIGTDLRIGPAFLFAGAGWGGSCFGKDMRALAHLGNQHQTPLSLIEAALDSNASQPLRVVEKLKNSLGSLENTTVALWGLSFKPGTDDVRDAPSLVVARALLEGGAALRVYDPKGQDNFLRALGPAPRVFAAPSAYEALRGADALALLTEWGAFRTPDFHRIKGLLAKPIIVDGRNQYDPEQLAKLGFTYSGIGRAGGA
jgi:UDPglucose 6-dehydrogenase